MSSKVEGKRGRSVAQMRVYRFLLADVCLGVRLPLSFGIYYYVCTCKMIEMEGPWICETRFDKTCRLCNIFMVYNNKISICLMGDVAT